MSNDSLYNIIQREHDLDKIKYLFKKNPDEINKEVYNFHSYLHMAATFNHSSDVIKFLIKSGLDPNKEDKVGNTPLFYATRNGNRLNIMETLINNGANVNHTNHYGTTALYFAVAQKQHSVEMIDLLIANGIDLNKKDHKNRTPLHYIAQSYIEYNSHSINKLIEAGVDQYAVSSYQDNFWDIMLSNYISKTEIRHIYDIFFFTESFGDINIKSNKKHSIYVINEEYVSPFDFIMYDLPKAHSSTDDCEYYDKINYNFLFSVKKPNMEKYFTKDRYSKDVNVYGPFDQMLIARSVVPELLGSHINFISGIYESGYDRIIDELEEKALSGNQKTFNYIKDKWNTHYTLSEYFKVNENSFALRGVNN